MPLTAKVINATGAASASAALSNGIEPNELIVIDWIAAACVAGTTSATVTANGFEVAVVPVATGGASVYLDFSNGFPCWAASNTDSVPATSVTVSIASTSATACDVTVGYHHERVSDRREWI